MDVAPGLYEPGESRPWGSSPLQKEKRLAGVASVMLKAAAKGFISLVQCASGQDRTGTAIEKTTQTWQEARYKELGLETGNIETMRAMGGNAAEITSHHIPGSRGMKTESKAGDTFGKAANEQFYLASAKTNKKNPTDKNQAAALNKLLQTPCAKLV